MSSDVHNHSPDNDLLRAHLLKWSALLTLDPDKQRRLIDQTIAVASDDTDVLDAKMLMALKRVMQRLTSPETFTRLSALPHG